MCIYFLKRRLLSFSLGVLHDDASKDWAIDRCAPQSHSIYDAVSQLNNDVKSVISVGKQDLVIKMIMIFGISAIDGLLQGL